MTKQEVKLYSNKKMSKTLTQLYDEIMSLPNVILETSEFKMFKPTHELAENMYTSLMVAKENGEKVQPFLFWNSHRLFRAIISEIKKHQND